MYWLRNYALLTICAVMFGMVTGCSGPANRSPKTIRVMTYNIHHGAGADGKIDLARIAQVISQEKADIVGIQEVDRGVQRSGQRDLAVELAQLTGMHFYFEKNISYQGGDYGNGILSRFPMVSNTNLHYTMLHPDQQRGLMQVVVDVHGKQLLFLNTHVDYRDIDTERLLNAAQIREVVSQQQKLPVVLVGDFNCEPGSRVHRVLKTFLHDAWEKKGQGTGFTYLSNDPHKQLDYIFYRPGDRLKLRRSWIPQTIASDHLPMVAEFELR